MGKRRLPLSVLAALGLAAPKCEPEPPMMPCLSIMPDSPDDRNRRANAEADVTLQPCLSPVADTGLLQPCLEVAPEPVPEPRMAPCLSPMPPPRPDDVIPPPEMTVCLSIEVQPMPSGDKNAGPTKPSAEGLFESGVLPPDVVQALRKRKES